MFWLDNTSSDLYVFEAPVAYADEFGVALLSLERELGVSVDVTTAADPWLSQMVIVGDNADGADVGRWLPATRDLVRVIMGLTPTGDPDTMQIVGCDPTPCAAGEDFELDGSLDAEPVVPIAPIEPGAPHRPVRDRRDRKPPPRTLRVEPGEEEPVILYACGCGNPEPDPCEGVECSTSNPCKRSSCRNGRCVQTSWIDGTPCTSDGDPCTVDKCKSGTCRHPPLCPGEDCCEGYCCSGTCCNGGAGPCCGSQETCCGLSCCGEFTVCCNGSCHPCCDGVTGGPCQGTCCDPPGGPCCGGTIAAAGEQCCESNTMCCLNHCCYDKCCPHAGGQCCSTSPAGCCTAEEQCCPFACCPANGTCCSSSPTGCCNSGEFCCETSPSGCCPDGDQCCPSGCCPDDQQCCDSGCCPFGEKCCPDGNCALCCDPATGGPCSGTCCGGPPGTCCTPANPCCGGTECCDPNRCCENGECCSQPCEGCVDHGTLSDRDVVLSASPDPACVGDTIMFAVEGVVDDGWIKRVNCSAKQPMPGEGVTYSWAVRTPNGSLLSGPGSVAYILADRSGSYQCTFTAHPDRTECPPTELELAPITATAATSATLTASPTFIPADTAWGMMPPLSHSEITVQWDPPDCEGELEVVEVGLTDGYQPPSNGTLTPDSQTLWRYKAFDEPRWQLHPTTVRVWIGAVVGGIELDRVQVQVAPVYRWWVTFHQHGPTGTPHAPPPTDYEQGYEYLVWKYSTVVATTGGEFEAAYFSPNQCVVCVGTCAAACTTIWDEVTFGTSALDVSENKAASTIGHELVHTVGAFNQSECTAYTWEWEHRLGTGIDEDAAYILDVQQKMAAECP